jgi:hypothetical protein
MRPVQELATLRGGARPPEAAIIALALVCFSLGACGGSSNSGTTVASGSSDTHSSTQAARGSSGSSGSSVVGTTGAQGKPAAASGSPRPGSAAAVSSYSLAGGCLLVGSTRTCDLPRSLVRDYREPAVEKAIDEFVSCLDKRGTSGVALSGCRYELASDVILHRHRPPD